VPFLFSNVDVTVLGSPFPPVDEKAWKMEPNADEEGIRSESKARGKEAGNRKKDSGCKPHSFETIERDGKVSASKTTFIGQANNEFAFPGVRRDI